MTPADANQLNYRILGVPADADLDELKAAYHRAAKQTHPDLAPAARKRRAELKMMRINEAYMAILAERMRPGAAHRVEPRSATAEPGAARPQGPAPGAPDPRPPRTGKELARPRDPGYTYYKLGFDFYRRGYTELYSKDPRIIRKQLAELKTYDHYLLSLTISALKHFERSYGYFSLVLEQAPESIWVADARAKLRKLEKFNRIYQRICENLSRSLRAKRQEEADHRAERSKEPQAPTGQPS
jgi:hypothetical protein